MSEKVAVSPSQRWLTLAAICLAALSMILLTTSPVAAQGSTTTVLSSQFLTVEAPAQTGENPTAGTKIYTFVCSETEPRTCESLQQVADKLEVDAEVIAHLTNEAVTAGMIPQNLQPLIPTTPGDDMSWGPYDAPQRGWVLIVPNGNDNEYPGSRTLKSASGEPVLSLYHADLYSVVLNPLGAVQAYAADDTADGFGRIIGIQWVNPFSGRIFFWRGTWENNPLEWTLHSVQPGNTLDLSAGNWVYIGGSTQLRITNPHGQDAPTLTVSMRGQTVLNQQLHEGDYVTVEGTTYLATVTHNFKKVVDPTGTHLEVELAKVFLVAQFP